MAYVDLNPIRAGMEKSFTDSEFTYIKERIETNTTDLFQFGNCGNDLSYSLSSYIDLVDETGRVLRDDMKGYISHKLGSALTELELNPYTWLDELKGFKSVGFSAVGTVNQLKEYSQKTQRKWSVGIRLKPTLEKTEFNNLFFISQHS